MAETKTKPTNKSVDDFLNNVTPEDKKKDCFALLKMMEEITHEKATMWGPTIVGFGTYHYKYATGHEGDMPLAGFAPRQGNIVVYLIPGFTKYTNLVNKLGKFKNGVSCLYIKKLSDIDENVLKELIDISIDETSKVYPS